MSLSHCDPNLPPLTMIKSKLPSLLVKAPQGEFPSLLLCAGFVVNRPL